MDGAKRNNPHDEKIERTLRKITSVCGVHTYGFYIYTPTRVEDQGIPNYSVVEPDSPDAGRLPSANLTAVPTETSEPAPVIQEARALLAEQFGKFTLSRVKDEQGWSYKAEGSVNFFGDSLVRVDGARGRNWTERLPVHFGWLAA